MASRKRKPLTLREKLNILALVDRDPKRKRIDIAKDLGLPASTVNTVVSKRKQIEENALVFGAATKQARGAKQEELEDALLKWFKQARASGVNFDGSILREKAMEIADIMGIEDFAASNGWMDRFRVRHGISYRQVNGEAASVNPADIENWISLLPGVVNAYAPRDVYNADELGLFFKVQPTKSPSLKGESCHGGKVSKDRVTVLLCCNKDGTEMIKPWMIGKWKNPTCLKNLARLPCVYKHNTKAWMTCSLFEVFLRSSKDTSFLRNLRVVFLPANTTSHLQPLDAGIIKNVKHLYRKCIVRRFLARVSRGEDPGKLTLLDAMHYLNASWESVTSETVKNCFRKCGFRRSPEVEEPEPCVSGDPDPCETEDDYMDEELRSAGAELAFSDFVAVDDDVPTCDPQTVADIVAELRQGQVTGDEHDDDEDEPETPPRATFAQAVAALDVLRSYFATKDTLQGRARKVAPSMSDGSKRTTGKHTTLDSYRRRQPEFCVDIS
ncbi:tigger transposable element-derived protein 6-like [Ixodes scapularis]